MDDNQFDPDIFSNAEKLNVVLEVYKTHSELLKTISQIDLRVFGGYITIHIVSAGFIISRTEFSPFEFAGIIILSTVVSFVAFMLVRNSFLRRGEAARIMQNANIALGLREEGFFLRERRLHFYWSDSKTIPAYRPWQKYYQLAIVVGWIGFLLLTLSK